MMPIISQNHSRHSPKILPDRFSGEGDNADAEKAHAPGYVRKESDPYPDKECAPACGAQLPVIPPVLLLAAGEQEEDSVFPGIEPTVPLS
jgi:hypothetical protein